MVHIKYYQVRPETFDNPILSITIGRMRYYGLIIGTNQRYPLWPLMRSIFFTLSFIAFAILNVIRTVRGIHILLADFLLRPTTFLAVTTAINAVNVYLQRERIVRLITFVHEELQAMRSCTDRWEDELLTRTVNYLRRISLAFLSIQILNYAIAVLQCVGLTILDPDMMYYKVLAPQKLNGTVQPIITIDSYPFGEVLDNFILGYTGALYAHLLTIFSIPTLYIFNSCLMTFLSFKIEIIGKRFSEMNLWIFDPKLKNTRALDNLTETEKNHLRLKMCAYYVERQIKIRWFVKEFQQLYRFPIFFDSLVFSLLLCVLLYFISCGGPLTLEYMYAAIFIAGSAALQALHHWHATVLTKTHDAMVFDIYSCDWYNYPLKVQKNIRLIMMESSKPLMISALLIDLKLETLLDIFRGAFSYFCILRNLKM